MFFNKYFAFNRDRNGHWDLNLVFVDLKLRFNAGDLWGYDCMGVGSSGSVGVNEALVVGGGNGRKGSIRVYDSTRMIYSHE